MINRSGWRAWALLFGWPVALAVALIVAVPATSAFAALTEYPLAAGSQPDQIATGADSALWFTDPGNNSIGRITTSGTATAFTSGLTAAAGLDGIALGSDGNVWFTEAAKNAVGRITPAGVITEFSLAALGANTGPTSIVGGPGGLLYFTEANVGRIGRIDPNAGSDANILASETQSAVVPSGAGAGLNGIALGPDTNLWFTETNVDRVGVINPALTTITEFIAGITAGSAPTGITGGSDGALWFTENAKDQIGRITTSGTVTNEFAAPGTSPAPTGIASGSDGALWFTETGADAIGRITTAGTATATALSASSAPKGIASGPDAAVWFTEPGRSAIGRLPTTPQNIAPPAITGGGLVGQTLSCSQGSWSNDPTSFAYAWTLGGSDIAGATGSTYTPSVPGTYACRVTATNQAGSTSHLSATLDITQARASAGEDPKCKKLRKKLKRQEKSLAKTVNLEKRAHIQANIKDTRKRLRKLDC